MHVRLLLGRVYVVEHPLPRGCASPRILEIQVDDDLEALGMYALDGWRVRIPLGVEGIVLREETPDHGSVQRRKAVAVPVLLQQPLDSLVLDRLFQGVVPLLFDFLQPLLLDLVHRLTRTRKSLRRGFERLCAGALGHLEDLLQRALRAARILLVEQDRRVEFLYLVGMIRPNLLDKFEIFLHRVEQRHGNHRAVQHQRIESLDARLLFGREWSFHMMSAVRSLVRMGLADSEVSSVWLRTLVLRAASA